MNYRRVGEANVVSRTGRRVRGNTELFVTAAAFQSAF